MTIGLVLLNRNLRLQDNLVLERAFAECDQVLVGLILSEVQLREHPFASTRRRQLFLQILQGLQEKLRSLGSDLLLGQKEILAQLLDWKKAFQVEKFYTAPDVSPFARQREQVLRESKLASNFVWVNDLFLHAPEEVLKGDGMPYTVFTPYYRKAFAQPHPSPIQRKTWKKLLSFQAKDLNSLCKEEIGKSIPCEPNLYLKRFEKSAHYEEFKDFPDKEGNSRTSVALRFGLISPRQAHLALGDNPALQRQIYWRDFFSQIAWHFPEVFTGAFHKRYRKLKWDANEKHWQAWCNGKTGFPLVDAAMRELTQTGFMHGRCRMVTASFLVKDLHIDWMRGDAFFAQHLLDHDPALNNGNWQWAASTGCDAQPYFRIFNPWLQQKKFDPECRYIKKWLPELKGLSSKEIHNPLGRKDADYPRPIVDHSSETTKAKHAYKICSSES